MDLLNRSAAALEAVRQAAAADADPRTWLAEQLQGTSVDDEVRTWLRVALARPAVASAAQLVAAILDDRSDIA